MIDPSSTIHLFGTPTLLMFHDRGCFLSLRIHWCSMSAWFFRKIFQWFVFPLFICLLFFCLWNDKCNWKLECKEEWKKKDEKMKEMKKKSEEKKGWLLILIIFNCFFFHLHILLSLFPFFFLFFFFLLSFIIVSYKITGYLRAYWIVYILKL